MPGCKVDATKSPQFTKLRAHWAKSYPHIDADLEDAFRAIEQNISAKDARRVPVGSNVEVYKYRQNSKDIRRGAKYGWRIIALLDKATSVLYPMIVYPKPAWDDAGTRTIIDALSEVMAVLGYCQSPACDGRMAVAQPVEHRVEGAVSYVKVQCGKCKAIQWKTS